MKWKIVPDGLHVILRQAVGISKGLLSFLLSGVESASGRMMLEEVCFAVVLP